MTDWQPIEKYDTRKHGRIALVCVLCARSINRERHLAARVYLAKCYRYGDGEKQHWEAYPFELDGDAVEVKPTHFMPLPAPPPLVIDRALDVRPLDLAGGEKAQEDRVGQSNSAEPR